MISPIFAAGREKSASELSPDSTATKPKPEGEKNGLFSRLLHRCEQCSETPVPEDSRTGVHLQVIHAVFPAILRGMNGSIKVDDPSMENEGAEATLAGEEPDSLFSGEIQEEKVFSAEEALQFPEYLPPDGTARNESEAAAAVMMVRDGVSLLPAGEGIRGPENGAGPAEEKGTVALPPGSSPLISSGVVLSEIKAETGQAAFIPKDGTEKQDYPAEEKGTVALPPGSSPLISSGVVLSEIKAETGQAAFIPKDGTEKQDVPAEREAILEKNEQTARTSPEKHLSDALAGEKRATDRAPGNGADLGNTAGALPVDHTPGEQEKNGGTQGRDSVPLSFASGKDAVFQGTSRGGGEKGEGRQSLFGKNDEPGAALFAQKPAQGADGVRAERPPLPAGFARELALAGRDGAALEDGMHNVVRFMRTEGHHRASMIVDPPALGRVEIELSATTGGVEASIRVGNEQLRQLVQDQITVLRTHLQQQGVQVAELTVDIRDSGKEGRGETRDGAKDRNLRGSRMVGAAEEDIPSFAVDLEQGLLHWVA